MTPLHKTRLIVGGSALAKMLNTDKLEFLWIADFRAHWLQVTKADLDGDTYRLTIAAESMRTSISNNGVTKLRLSKNSRLENSLGLISSGEWYFDSNQSILIYKPLPNEIREEFTAEIPIASSLLELRGDGKVGNYKITGLHFRMSAWENATRDAFLSNQAGANWTQPLATGINYDVGHAPPYLVTVPAAVRIDNTANVAFKNNIIESVGGSGLSIAQRTSNVEVAQNVFYQTGAEAIVVGDSQHPVSSQKQGLCANIKLTQNIIRKAGELFPSCPGITAYYVTRCRIISNDLADLPYSGISLGWGWKHHPEYAQARENEVAKNRVNDFMKTCRDGGGIYTLGPQPESVVADNYIHDAKSSGIFGAIYHDQGSAYFLTRNNVIKGIPSWLDLNSARSVIISSNFTDTEKWVDHGVDCKIYDTQFILDDHWPDKAQEIMKLSGISPESWSSAQRYALEKLIPSELEKN